MLSLGTKRVKNELGEKGYAPTKFGENVPRGCGNRWRGRWGFLTRARIDRDNIEARPEAITFACEISRVTWTGGDLGSERYVVEVNDVPSNEREILNQARVASTVEICSS